MTRPGALSAMRVSTLYLRSRARVLKTFPGGLEIVFCGNRRQRHCSYQGCRIRQSHTLSRNAAKRVDERDKAEFQSPTSGTKRKLSGFETMYVDIVPFYSLHYSAYTATLQLYQPSFLTYLAKAANCRQYVLLPALPLPNLRAHGVLLGAPPPRTSLPKPVPLPLRQTLARLARHFIRHLTPSFAQQPEQRRKDMGEHEHQRHIRHLADANRARSRRTFLTASTMRGENVPPITYLPDQQSVPTVSARA